MRERNAHSGERMVITGICKGAVLCYNENAPLWAGERSGKMLRIAICDDTESFLQDTQEMVKQWPNCPDGVYVSCFFDADALIETHKAEPFDIILLDVVMPLLNGIEAAAEIRRQDRTVKIVFLSVSPEFAVDSYTVKADNYLLKPVNKQRLFDCLDELQEEIQKLQKSVTVKSASAVHRINLQDIEFLESQGKLVMFSLTNGLTIHGTEPLYAYEKSLLLEDGFFKCHRSYLVNIYKIKTYTHKEITMGSGVRIPISRSCHKEFETAYFATLFGKAGDL